MNGRVMSATTESDQIVRFAPKPYKGLAGIVIGSLITLAGLWLTAFPISTVFFHPSGGEDIPGPGFLERVTPESSRVYGAAALIFGSCLIWFSRWPRWGKRNAAIEDYVWGLSQELDRRFGLRNFYSVKDVTKLVHIGGYRMEFVAYAHAIFCSRYDFDEEYRFRKEKLAYYELRDVVARRHFADAREFDAASVVRLARPRSDEDHERWIGAAGW
jgi:hypothetical protein